VQDDLEFRCPEPGCGRSFGTAQGVARHGHETHGYPSYKDRLKSGAAVRPSRAHRNGNEAESRFRDRGRIDELAATLRAALVDDERRLLELEDEKQSILERVRPIRAAISSLTREHVKPGPKQFPGRGPGDRVGKGKNPVSESAIERVSTFLKEHADEVGATFNAVDLNVLLRANGIGMNISDERRVLKTMHERGLLRLISADGPGGRKIYGRLPERAPFVDREPERAL